MVESSLDKSTFCSHLICDQERVLWDAVKDSLNICDNFHSDRGLKYSWDNGRHEGQRILARLHRFYIFYDPPLGHSHSISSYTIKGECSLSDHLPVTLSLKLGDSPRKKGAWKMNTRYIKETSEEVK